MQRSMQCKSWPSQTFTKGMHSNMLTEVKRDDFDAHISNAKGKKNICHELVHVWRTRTSLDNMSVNDERVRFSGELYNVTHADNPFHVRAVK